MKKLLLIISVVFIYSFTFNIDNCSSQWEQVSIGIPSNSWVIALEGNSNYIYTGMRIPTGYGVNLSTNNGLSWNAILPTPNVWSLLLNGSNLFAGTLSSGVYLTTNNGINWNAVNNGLSNLTVYSIAANGNNIFAGTGQGVFLTTNNGINWNATGSISSPVKTFLVVGNNIFAGVATSVGTGGVYFSSNNGASWNAVNNGIPNVPVPTLAKKGNNIYAGTQGSGMFLSTNNGSNWMTINDGLTDLYVDCIAINGNNIYIGTDVAGIYISTNDGTNWTSMNQGLYTTTSGYLFSLKILNSYLFAGTYDHSCWRFNLYSPNLISPLNNSVGNQINLNLIWSKRIDALKYNVILSTDSLFTSIILNDSTLTDTIKNVTSLSFLTNYFWKVRIKDSTGWRPFSNKWKFTTTAGLPLNLKVYLEGFWNGTNQVSDTVNIYLAGSLSPHNLVDSQKVVLNSIGTSNPAFTKASSGSYYIIVKHRNHLETWSGLPQTFVSGVPLSYDFTTDSTKAFGMNMKKVGSVWVLIVGDANQDGSIDAIDVTDLLIPQFGNIGYLSCDFNGDGSVDADDVPYMIENYGLTKVVPTLEALPLEIIRQKQIIKKQELNNTFKKKKNINLIKNE